MGTRSPFGLVEYRTHYRWAVIAVTVLFLTLLFRFLTLQIVRGGEYQKALESTRHRSERIPAKRGLIVDRNGEVLARNVDSYDLVVRPHLVKDPDRIEERLGKLLHLDDHEHAQLRELISAGMDQKRYYDSVVIRRDLVSEHCPFDSTRLEPVPQKKESLWCMQCGRSYQAISNDIKHCARNSSHKLKWNDTHTGAVCGKCGSEYVSSSSCPHDGAPLRIRKASLVCGECGRGFNNEKAIVEANLYQMPGVEIRASNRRVYKYRNLTAHIVGYMNQVNKRDLAKHGKLYAAGDRIGRSGVERALEESLRGTWGLRNYTLSRPNINGPIVQQPNREKPDTAVQDGLTVKLTLDIKLQRIAQSSLRYYRSGAAVILDATNGDLLAMYSKPSFDPNQWSGRLSREVYQSAMNNPYTPLMNKALTAYAPASGYKVVTSLAGLHTNTFTPSTEIQCNGAYEYGGRRFRCWHRAGHGPLDLVHALSRSCDVYYYRLGELLGMETLHQYATQYFGFGRPTGIEVAESVGVVPDKDWHREQERVWMPGFTLSTAVGQKDVRASPLQMARAFMALANGGKLYQVHVVNQVEEPNGNVVRVVRPAVDVELPLNVDHMAVINEGLWRVVNDEHGTAFNARMDGIEISGKTGTAEAAEHKAGVSQEIATWMKDDHAWFVGFAPSRKPEIAVAVFLEHGHSGGKAAAPAAMKIFKGYFSQRIPEAAIMRDQDNLPNPIAVPKGTEKKLPTTKDDSVNRTPIDIE